MALITIVVKDLIFDDYNIDHILRHNVTPAEVWESLQDPYMIAKQANQGRVMSLGRSGERLLSIILNQQSEPNVYYVVTARDMSKKERALYREQKGLT